MTLKSSCSPKKSLLKCPGDEHIEGISHKYNMLYPQLGRYTRKPPSNAQRFKQLYRTMNAIPKPGSLEYRARFMSKYKAERRRQANNTDFGWTPGFGNTKTNRVLQLDASAKNSRTLYVDDCTNIPRTTTNEITRRQRDLLDLRGIRVVFEVQRYFLNDVTKNGIALTMNYALISNRNNTSGTPSGTDFFRGTIARSEDFSTNLSSTELNHSSINSDLYTVHAHSRVKVPVMPTRTYRNGAGNNVYEVESFPSITIDKYFPIKRQIRYTDNTGQSCCNPVYFVYWFDRINNAAATTSQSSQLGITGYIDTVFKETCGC